MLPMLHVTLIILVRKGEDGELWRCGDFRLELAGALDAKDSQDMSLPFLEC
jgi:hypothetical protein